MIKKITIENEERTRPFVHSKNEIAKFNESTVITPAKNVAKVNITGMETGKCTISGYGIQRVTRRDENIIVETNNYYTNHYISDTLFSRKLVVENSEERHVKWWIFGLKVYDMIFKKSPNFWTSNAFKDLNYCVDTIEIKGGNEVKIAANIISPELTLIVNGCSIVNLDALENKVEKFHVFAAGYNIINTNLAAKNMLVNLDSSFLHVSNMNEVVENLTVNFSSGLFKSDLTIDNLDVFVNGSGSINFNLIRKTFKLDSTGVINLYGNCMRDTAINYCISGWDNITIQRLD